MTKVSIIVYNIIKDLMMMIPMMYLVLMAHSTSQIKQSQTNRQIQLLH